ncbi:MAG TPA: fatty acyl-AMP ligase [Polyangiaceae bacterium]|nr:fatty acyl-AMP ligase [Polyangiaceae bacterium]
MPSRLAAPTLVDAVRAIADDRDRGFVFVKPDGTERLYTFHAIAVEAERRAAQLLARGLQKGDRVALVIPEGDEFVLSFLGAQFAGGIPVPIYPQVSFKNLESYHDTVAHIAQASGATMLVTTNASKPFVDPAFARGSSTSCCVLTVDDLAESAAGGAPRVDVRVSPDDLALLQFTSGSTARPKGVMVTHANLAANAAAFMIDGLRRDERTDKGVSWLPLFHDMGLIGFVVGPLFTHVPCVFLPTASFVRSPRLWLDKIHQHRGTITYAPSFAYALVAKRLKDKELEGLDLSCLRVAGCGAEPIRARALRDFAAKLAPSRFDPRAFVPSYGMAEATLAITFAPLGGGLRTDEVDPAMLTKGEAMRAPGPDEASQEIVDCGIPFPAHELAIVDESGRRLGERRVGQIVTRGPSVTKGYYRNPELTAQALKPLAEEGGAGRGTQQAAWLHTGDLGYIVGGRLFVCGRLKEIIIIRGRNYYPSDIEWAVGELAAVRRGNALAFGAPVDGEEKLVVCCEGTASDAGGIQDGVRVCVGAQFGLEVHEVVVAPPASLPRTSSGKPQRNKTRQMYLDGTLPRARSVHTPIAIGDTVASTEGNAPIAGPQTT